MVVILFNAVIYVFFVMAYVFLLYVYVSSSCQLTLFFYPDWGFSVLFPPFVGWSSVQAACYSLQPNFQPTATQKRVDRCGNQHYSRELLMMGIVVPETCWAYKKYNKIISST